MTDDELIGILDAEGALWIIRAGGGELTSRGSLRLALERAWRQTEQGAWVTEVVRLPNDDVIIDAAQINRVWERLGWLPN